MQDNFKPIKDGEIRDIAVRWYEQDGRLEVVSIVREKTFWERHGFLRTLVVLLAFFIPVIGIGVGLWQHNLPAIIGAVLLRILWVMVFVPRIGGAKTEIEMRDDHA